MTFFKAPASLGKWKLGTPIGHGGQGQVYEAVAEEASAVCAIKVVQMRDLQLKKRKRFVQEIREQLNLTSVSAPGIIPVLDHNLGEIEAADGAEFGFIVMPLAKGNLGGSLAVFQGRVELVLEMFLGVLAGVRAAHRAGIVHRDIKPKNILFLGDGYRDPVVSDFGICLLRDGPRVTEVEETVGAKFFMAPEQERGGQVTFDPRTDVYALGKLLHFALTGRHVFREEIDPPPLFKPDELHLDPRYSAIEARLLRRTICADVNHRIATVDEMIDIVKEILGGGTPTGNPPPSGSGPSHPTEPEPAPAAETDREAKAFETSYRESVLGFSRTSGYANLAFEEARSALRGYWATSASAFANTDEARTAALALPRRFPQVWGLATAYGRGGPESDYRRYKQTIESILRLAGDKEPNPVIGSVPYPFAGLLYMSSSIAGLENENWPVLRDLLNVKFEWYYQSGRPIFDIGPAMSYFFHANVLGRHANEIHDYFRQISLSMKINAALGLSEDAFLDRYLQTQMLQCLRIAKDAEAGSDDHVWADFARFYEWRVIPMLDRIFADDDFAKGIASCFDESPSQWRNALNNRLATIQKRNWLGHSFFWESVRSYEPR